jgi:alkanesulfonate monooxygenase SsuD/methylene tetrahydromethanopterin reductase-like flavin-dependent oxidoreductase (luciferase family)
LKLGIGLPTWMGNLMQASDVLDWARTAEEAGFHALAVHDKPNHDTWDPLAALAVVAPVTSRVRLVTGALLLPLRDEAFVAKQTAVIDQVSGGRLELGVAVGVRPDDFELVGRPMAGRGKRYEGQLERLIELWRASVDEAESGKAAGPAPAQRPHPMLLVGGYQPAAIQRAVRFGDGYIFGAPGPAMMADRIPAIRAAAEAAGCAQFPISALAYVVPSEDPGELADGEALLSRYYVPLHKPFLDLVHTGSAEQVREAVKRYEEAGVDTLHLIPVSRSISAIERLARDVLPSYS